MHKACFQQAFNLVFDTDAYGAGQYGRYASIARRI
jgi:hypothetical protein